MEDFIIIAILVVIIGCAIAYIIKEKKKGVKCVGCPNAEMCARAQKESCQSCSGGCSSKM